MFRDRLHAGAQLAQLLAHTRGGAPVVAGLTRGGVPVAHAVAAGLAAPLEALVVRKLGAPAQPEYAVGAIGEGVTILNEEAIRSLGVSGEELAIIEERERAELTRRICEYRRGRPPADLRGRTIIVVDDGIATGASAVTACQVAHARGAERIILAVPVAPAGWHPPPDAHVDEFVSVISPRRLGAVGRWYKNFTQVTHAEVVSLLDSASGAE